MTPLIVIALVFALVKIVAGSRREARRRALAGVAQRFGLGYSPVDGLGLVDHSFALYNLSDGAGCREVVWGDWHGVPVQAGELRFTTSKGPEAVPAFSVALVDVRAFLPHVTIRRRPSILPRPPHVSLDRFRFESGEFNRRYEVGCLDREFAWNFVDVGMMQWLLQADHRFEFEAAGHRLLIYSRRLEPNQIPVLLGTAKGFHDHVPRVVLREFAFDPPDEGPAQLWAG